MRAEEPSSSASPPPPTPPPAPPPPPAAASEVSNRHTEVATWVADRHRLHGPVSVLSFEALETGELDLLMEVELQRTPVDATGRRRLPKTLWQADALRQALLRRRDELRAAREAAREQLDQATRAAAQTKRGGGGGGGGAGGAAGEGGGGEGGGREGGGGGGGGSSHTRRLCAAIAAGRAAALEGDVAADGIGPLGEAKGRWVTDSMFEAYVQLAAQLCDDRSPAVRAAALRRLVSLAPRTAPLGLDRYGRRHWALPPPLDEPSAPEAASCVFSRGRWQVALWCTGRWLGQRRTTTTSRRGGRREAALAEEEFVTAAMPPPTAGWCMLARRPLRPSPARLTRADGTSARCSRRCGGCATIS